MRGFSNPGGRASFAKGRLKRGEMNDAERRYAEYLDARVQDGSVLWWKFEPIKLRVADGAFYVPDFMVLVADSTLEIHEVKGHWQDDARLKVKVAQSLYPFRFMAIRAVPTSRGGGWEVEDFEKLDAPLLPGMRDKADVPRPIKRGAPAPVKPERPRRLI